MFKYENGVLKIRQGDSGKIIVNGLNPDNNYFVYFAIVDENYTRIGSEIMVTSNNKDTVTITLSASFTDKLVVPQGEDVAVYYWGIKVMPVGLPDEDTVTPDFSKKNVIQVYPKIVEGAVE